MTTFDAHTHDLSTRSGIVNIRYGEPSPPVLPTNNSVGIHPWDVGKLSIDSQFRSLAQAAAAIGECGLDKPCGVDMHLQREVFLAHVALANELHKPVIVHCVRAYGLLSELSQALDRHTPWILHSCYASRQWIESNLDRPFFFSLSRKTLMQKRGAEVLHAIPFDRLLLETDDSGEPIAAAYETAADILRCSLPSLQSQIASTAARLFGLL